jgi:hypothetical protein
MSRTRRRGNDETLRLALACGATVEAAALKAGVSVRTAYRRLKCPEFQEALKALREDFVRRTSAALTATAMETSRLLIDLQKSAAPPGVRLGAMRTVLQYAGKLRDEVDLLSRIVALEEKLEVLDKAR